MGSSFRRERREVQTPPLCEFRLAGGVWLVGLTSVFAPGKFWRKGLLRFWLTADLYRGFTSLDSGIFSQNFNTVTNFVKLKLQVQFDICCRTGLILRSLTETKRNWTFALRGRTNSRQSAVSLINSLMIWYSPIRAMKKGMICTNSPRLTPPREHANATTKAYVYPRD